MSRYVENPRLSHAGILTTRQRLRYLDYHLLRRPANAQLENRKDEKDLARTGLHELDTVKDFGACSDTSSEVALAFSPKRSLADGTVGH